MIPMARPAVMPHSKTASRTRVNMAMFPLG
jgi:hypothetical protein